MGIGLYILITALFIITLLLTFYAFNQIDKEIKGHEAKDSSVKDEIRRSHEFETASIGRHLPVQIWLYVITIVGSLIGLAIYFYML